MDDSAYMLRTMYDTPHTHADVPIGVQLRVIAYSLLASRIACWN